MYLHPNEANDASYRGLRKRKTCLIVFFFVTFFIHNLMHTYIGYYRCPTIINYDGKILHLCVRRDICLFGDTYQLERRNIIFDINSALNIGISDIRFV